MSGAELEKLIAETKSFIDKRVHLVTIELNEECNGNPIFLNTLPLDQQTLQVNSAISFVQAFVSKDIIENNVPLLNIPTAGTQDKPHADHQQKCS